MHSSLVGPRFSPNYIGSLPQYFQLSHRIEPILVQDLGIPWDYLSGRVPQHLRNRERRDTCSRQAGRESVAQVINREEGKPRLL